MIGDWLKQLMQREERYDPRGFWRMTIDDIPTVALMVVFFMNMLLINLVFGYSVWTCFFIAFLLTGAEVTLALKVVNERRARAARSAKKSEKHVC